MCSLFCSLTLLVTCFTYSSPCPLHPGTHTLAPGVAKAKLVTEAISVGSCTLMQSVARSRTIKRLEFVKMDFATSKRPPQ